jgi:peptide/nickel transport system permease protein
VLFFVGRRAVSALTVVFATLVTTFALFFIAPTDPAGAICGERNCTPERYQEIKQNLHLDEPKIEQLASYLKGIVAGRTFETAGVVQECDAPCLGFSFKSDQPVLEVLESHIPVTLSLVLGYSVIVLTVGVFVGAMAAKRHGTAGDRALMAGTLVLSSVPYYIVALMVALYFTGVYQILPRGGWTPPSESLGHWALGLITPWLVLGLYSCTLYARFSRGSMVETLGEDYIRTARAKGVSNRSLTYKHAMRAALIPVVTIFGLDLAGLLAGAIFTERVFDLPGLGNLVLDSMANYDLPVIMGTVLVSSVIIVVMNLMVDITYSIIDPRVRLT